MLEKMRPLITTVEAGSNGQLLRDGIQKRIVHDKNQSSQLRTSIAGSLCFWEDVRVTWTAVADYWWYSQSIQSSEGRQTATLLFNWWFILFRF